MDGVLVDFQDGYRKFAQGIKDAGLIKGMDKEEARAVVRQHYGAAGAGFWAKLGWANGGQALWNTAKRLFERVCILSSTGAKADPSGRGKEVEEGKLEWLKTNIPDMPSGNIFIVHGKHLKKNHAAKNAILVDDMAVTIKEWNEAGGYGILHDDRYFENTIETLVEIAAPMSLGEMAKSLPVVRRQFWNRS